MQGTIRRWGPGCALRCRRYERRISTSEVDKKTGQLVLHELSPDLLKLADPRTVRAEMTVKPVDEMLKLAKNIATEVAQPNLRYGVHSDIATTDHARLHNLKKRNEAEMAFFKSGKIVREESQAAWEEYLKEINHIKDALWTRAQVDANELTTQKRQEAVVEESQVMVSPS